MAKKQSPLEQLIGLAQMARGAVGQVGSALGGFGGPALNVHPDAQLQAQMAPRPMPNQGAPSRFDLPPAPGMHVFQYDGGQPLSVRPVGSGNINSQPFGLPAQANNVGGTNGLQGSMGTAPVIDQTNPFVNPFIRLTKLKK